MPVQPGTQGLIDRLNAATSKLAAKLTALTGALAAAETDEEVTNVLSPIVTALESMGADPENPVPPVP